MKNYLNLLKILKKNTHSGYTLVELIMASVVTVMVISAAGYGVYVMTRQNMIATAGGDMKYNLGRAVDFISEEVKTSATITADSSLTSLLSTCLAAGTGNEVGTGSTTPVLGLSVTTPSGQQNVIYYTQQPSSTWLGNRAIYRCGPGLDSNGAYTSSINSRLLIDLIASTKDSKDTAIACANGGTAYPNLTSGFFVCKSGNLAELHIASSALESQTSKNSLAADANDATYGIISQAYTRASDGIVITVNTSNNAKLTFAESAKVSTLVTSGCSSVTSIAFSTTQIISGVATPTTETWNPSTTNSWITTGTVSPVNDGSLATTPSLTFATGSSNNQVTATTGTCVFSLSLRRG